MDSFGPPIEQGRLYAGNSGREQKTALPAVSQNNTAFTGNPLDQGAYDSFGPLEQSNGLIEEPAQQTEHTSLHSNVPDRSVRIGPEIHCHSGKKPEKFDRSALCKLVVALIMCVSFMSAEIVGGIISNSLAVITDAAHLLTDLASFVIAIIAFFVARFEPTQRFPFGFYRAEIIGTLVSILLIWVVTGVLVYLAVMRLITGEFEIDAIPMLITSSLGVLFNILMGLVLGEWCNTDCLFRSRSKSVTAGDPNAGIHVIVLGSNVQSDRSQLPNNAEISSRSSNRSPSVITNPLHGPNLMMPNQERSSVENNGYQTDGGLSNSNQPITKSLNGAFPNTPNVTQYGATQHSNSPQTSNLMQSEHHEVAVSAEGGVPSQDAQRFTLPEISMPSTHHSHNHSHSHHHGHSHGHSHENLNVRAALIHVIGDLFQSVGVVVAAIIIFFKPEWKLADPICTFLFSIIVIITTLNILRDVFFVIMEAVPRSLDLAELKATLETRENGVYQVHDIRAWSLTLSKPVVTAHLSLDRSKVRSLSAAEDLLYKTAREIREKFGIHEVILQLEGFSNSMKNCNYCYTPS